MHWPAQVPSFTKSCGAMQYGLYGAMSAGMWGHLLVASSHEGLQAVIDQIRHLTSALPPLAPACLAILCALWCMLNPVLDPDLITS